MAKQKTTRVRETLYRTTLEYGGRTVSLTLFLDRGLDKLVRRALESKGGRARAVNGSLVVKAER